MWQLQDFSPPTQLLQASCRLQAAVIRISLMLSDLGGGEEGESFYIPTFYFDLFIFETNEMFWHLYFRTLNEVCH